MINFQSATVTLMKIKQCAVKADIYHAWFIAFGTMIGCVRPTARIQGDGFVNVRGFMEHDDDMDVGILADQITQEQEEAYIAYMKEAHLFDHRELYQRRTDTGRLLWASLRPKPAPVGTKCCNWFWQVHQGYYWHTKGTDWVDPGNMKFSKSKVPYTPGKDKAIMLGIPMEYLTGLVEVEFEGEMYNVPQKAGFCMDFWYPEYLNVRKRGSSARQIHCIVGEWENAQTWRVV